MTRNDLPDRLPDPRLQAYLDDELETSEREAVERDLAASPELRHQLQRLRAAGELTRAGEQPAPAAGHAERVRNHVASADQPWWQHWLPAPQRRLTALAWSGLSTLLLALVLAPLVPNAGMRETAPGAVGMEAAVMSPSGETRSMDAVVADEPTAELALAESDAAPATAAGSPLVEAELAPAPGAASAPGHEVAILAPSAIAAAPSADRLAAVADGAALEGKAMSRSRSVDGVAGYDVAGGATPVVAQEALKAGEVDDNAQFGKYLDYAAKMAGLPDVHRFSPRERYVIQVVDDRGRGVADATVRLSAESAPHPTQVTLRTDSSGQAVFFPKAYDNLPDVLQVWVTWPQDQATLAVNTERQRSPQGGTWQLKPTVANAVRNPGLADIQSVSLDVAFVVDTTGSMSEEINRIRDTIDEVSRRVQALPRQPRLRLGLVLYRDQGDDYVTRVTDFTDLAGFRAALQGVNANGGNDTPEHVNAGLAAAVNELRWSEPPAVRLAFLIGDAPPHLDYQDQVPDYLTSAKQAAARGIKFYTLSATGNDDVGEYVWRQVALMTRGKFMFLTRGGDAGVTPHHVDRQDYSVQNLPDLVVNAVARELAALGHKPGEMPEVTLPEPPDEPVVVAPPAPSTPPTPPRPSRSLSELRLPVWGYVLILVANLLGWLFAFRRSRQPLR